MERRFSTAHLQSSVIPNAALLYFEPESEVDRKGLDDYIEYLDVRERVGLVLEGDLRIILVPPCDYGRTQVGYLGRSLLGFVQFAYPPQQCTS